VFRKLTVAENIRPCWSCTSTRRHRCERLDELLQELHITHIRKTAPAISLSGGERRRVEIARALATARASSCSTNPSPASIRSP
jgi:lipopolysaccharide export system ATP-binding protein